MAFTGVLVLSLLATMAVAQFDQSSFGSDPFGNSGSFNLQPQQQSGFGDFGSLSGSLGYPQSRLPGLPSGGAGSFPSFASSRPGSRLATVHATNKAGDHLYLTIEEARDLDHPFQNPFVQSPFGGPQSPFGASPYGGDNNDLRVHGVFVKAGSQTGVQNPESLHGTFAMVVMQNGNTDGYCIGTGQPLRVPSRNPYNPYGSAFGGASPFSNPFSQLFPQLQQGRVVLVSTPLHATTGTSTVEGKIRDVTLNQLYGRSIHVTADTEAKVRTDLCGTIRRDDKTIEEFKAYQARHAALASGQIGQPLSGSNFGGLDSFGSGSLDPFAATATTGLTSSSVSTGSDSALF